MDSKQISNSIYISMASLESIIICFLAANNSIAYGFGLLWVFPLWLVSIPIYRVIKEVWNENKQQ